MVTNNDVSGIKVVEMHDTLMAVDLQLFLMKPLTQQLLHDYN